MQTVTELYDSMITEFATIQGITVKRYGGELGEHTSKSIVVQTPGLYVAFLGCRDIQSDPSDGMNLNTSWIAYAIAENADRDTRINQAIDIAVNAAEKLLINKFSYDFEDVGIPQSIEISNVLIDWIDLANQAVVALSWTQQINLQVN